MKMKRLIGILSILLQREKVTAPEPREAGAIRSRKMFGEYGLY